MDVRSRQAAAWMVFLVAAGAALAGLSVPALTTPAGGRAEFNKRRRLPVQLRVLQLVQGRQEALKSVRVTLERHKRRKRRARR